MTITHVRVGGYPTTMGGDALGIGLLRWNHDGANLELLDTTPTSSPSFLARGSEGVLFATDEAGRIEAFRPARVSPCNRSVASRRAVACPVT